ncbi:hypothetical protein LCGC14_1269640 [marine sediment metagenome]|uniref:Uncharacterized protein n=1 Tax=marine sediment metagenome TaxID=412755 RepID=A0A0F9KYG4_9ZZZZ
MADIIYEYKWVADKGESILNPIFVKIKNNARRLSKCSIFYLYRGSLYEYCYIISHCSYFMKIDEKWYSNYERLMEKFEQKFSKVDRNDLLDI